MCVWGAGGRKAGIGRGEVRGGGGKWRAGAHAGEGTGAMDMPVCMRHCTCSGRAQTQGRGGGAHLSSAAPTGAPREVKVSRATVMCQSAVRQACAMYSCSGAVKTELTHSVTTACWRVPACGARGGALGREESVRGSASGLRGRQQLSLCGAVPHGHCCHACACPHLR